MKFSANLGFLWQDRNLPDAIRAAARAGFDAVECHWPYVTPEGEVISALEETGMRMLGLNTIRGPSGQMGLSALPGSEDVARAAIDQAIEYATTVSAEAIHVMAGNARGAAARETFLSNLDYGRRQAPDEIILLIEPLNAHDAPGYFLRTTEQAQGILEDLGLPGVKLMFDCYHVGRTEGDVVGPLSAALPLIGHIQFAGVPDRGPPDRGEVDYRAVFKAIEEIGWKRPLGAEYRPDGETDDSLGWMEMLRHPTPTTESDD